MFHQTDEIPAGPCDFGWTICISGIRRWKAAIAFDNAMVAELENGLKLINRTIFIRNPAAMRE
jgi:hypothetical protein